jgi:hypothetical protein
MFAMLPGLPYIPRRASTVIAALLMLATLGAPVGLHLNGDIAIGQVRQIEPLGNDRVFLRLQLPLSSRAKPVVAAEAAVRERRIAIGDWLLAFGSIVQVDGRALFTTDTVVSRFDVLSPAEAVVGNWEERLRSAPFAAVLMGCTVLVAGNVLTTLATALLFAALCAVLTWATTTEAALAGWITVPPAGLYPIAATAAIAGLVLGWRISFRFGSIGQRLLTMACVFALMPAMTARFGWPDPVSYTLLIGAAAFPAVGYSLVGALFVAIGLQAHDQASFIILAVSACAVLIVQSRWGLPLANLATPVPKGIL